MYLFIISSCISRSKFGSRCSRTSTRWIQSPVDLHPRPCRKYTTGRCTLGKNWFAKFDHDSCYVLKFLIFFWWFVKAYKVYEMINFTFLVRLLWKFLVLQLKSKITASFSPSVRWAGYFTLRSRINVQCGNNCVVLSVFEIKIIV